MSTRPLRHFYDHDITFAVDDRLGSVVDPWLRHRRRFLDALLALDEDQWRSPTRCTDWDARDVISHLVTVDGFFVISLSSARNGAPTSFLPGFDPSTTPESLVAPMRDKSTDEILDQFAVGQATFEETVAAFEPEDWSALGESPVGHVTARLVLAHALWDSWLHERDIFEPLGLAPDIDDDELFTVAWYSLFIGGAQGGLLDDDAPVGPGLEQPIDVVLGFDELPERDLRVRVDHGVRIEPGDTPADLVVSAVDLVEAFTGRRDDGPEMERLAKDLRAHFARAREIL